MTKLKTKKITTKTTTPRKRIIKPKNITTIPIKTAEILPVINNEQQIAPLQIEPFVLEPMPAEKSFTFFNILVWTLPLIALSITAGVWWWDQQNQKLGIKNQGTINNSVVTNQKTTPELTAIAPLTGQAVTPEAAARRPWAVVVENFPTVRPQSGLASADIVFEAPTEGGITRFLAIFQSTLPERVGPIRSARPYFNDWARNFSALYSHSGGTSEALQQLKNKYGGLTDINEFFNEHAYERDYSRKPPHNLFTTATRFWNYIIEREFKNTITVPKFLFGKPNESMLASRIAVPYIPLEYAVVFTYNSTTQTYQRLVENEIQTDKITSTEITPANIIIMTTDITPIPNDPLLKVNLRTLGTGPLTLFTQGKSYQGQWSKTSLDSPLKFLTPAGTSLTLTPGQTWITIIDSSLTPEINGPNPTLEIK